MPAPHGRHQADIVAGLARLGINGAVEVHSSLSSFGRVEGGAEAVAGALVTRSRSSWCRRPRTRRLRPRPKGSS